jgi:Homeodomain-like domain
MQPAAVSETRTEDVEPLMMPVSPPKPRGRHNSLPEYTRYRDDGCGISESCLTCPLPRCRYEEPGGLRALLNETRDRQIIQMRLKGVPVQELAGRFGISRRTVFRVIGSTKLPARVRSAAYDTTPIPIRREQPREQTRKEAQCA